MGFKIRTELIAPCSVSVTSVVEHQEVHIGKEYVNTIRNLIAGKI